MATNRLKAIYLTTLDLWIDKRITSMASAVAFYSLFSVAPLLIVATAIAGSYMGDLNVQNYIFTQLSKILDTRGIELLESLVFSFKQQQTGWFASIASIALLLYGATLLFAEIQSSLNSLWDTKPKFQRGWQNFLWERFQTLLAVFVIGLLILLSLFTNTVLAFFLRFVEGYLPIPPQTLQLANMLTIFCYMTLVFCLMFRFFPSTLVPWKHVLLGGILTSLLFVLGEYGIGYYLAHLATTSVYGAAGSVAVLMLWVYYSALIFFIGACITCAAAKTSQYES